MLDWLTRSKLWQEHTSGVASAASNPDGSRIVTTSDDNTALLWDAVTAAVSPDGARIVTVTASDDKIARLWDAAGDKPLATLQGHAGTVWRVAFSPDGARIVTASYDGTARVWDAATGEVLAVLEGHANDVRSAAFSPDGARVVTTSDDNTARLWGVFPTTQALIDHAKRRLPRCLTRDQLRQFYLPGEPPRWCITGAGLEAERDPRKWQPLWPYHTAAWRDWLAARDRGQSPALPEE
jgi:WD40 repeat protein